VEALYTGLISALAEEREKWRAERELLQREIEIFEEDTVEPIHLNVGGVRYSTSLETLQKDRNSFFGAMFGGNLKPKPSSDGSYFIDRNGKHFGIILDFLRDGEVVLADVKHSITQALLREAKFYQIQGLIKALTVSLSMQLFPGSILLPSNNAEFSFLLNQWAGKPLDLKWTLIFRASRDGFSAERFHALCDNQGPTYTIVKVGHNIFGGYNASSWRTAKEGYHSSPGSFLFSLVNPHETPPTQLFSKKAGDQNEICSSHYHGPTFGAGNDLHISTNCNVGTASYSTFYTYTDPHGIGNNFFTGSQTFTVTDYEVYKL